MSTYLTIKTLQEKGYNTKIRLITFDFATKPEYIPTAKKLAHYLSELTGFKNFEEHYTHSAPLEQSKDPAKNWIIGNHTTAMFKLGAIDFIFDGLTKNPPESVRKDFPSDKFRQVDRDVPSSIFRHKSQASPLAFCDKQGVIELYKKFNLIEIILKRTLSCDVNLDEIVDGKLPCGNCWWCFERSWGLKTNNLDPNL